MAKKQVLGTFAAFLSNFIFGLSFMFTKTALNVAHPFIILAVRFSVAFLFMSVLLLFRVIKVNYRGKNLSGLLFMALSQPLCYFLFEVFGIKYTTSALSGIIISLIPVVVIMLSSTILKEKPTVMQIICSAVSLFGVAAISLVSKNTGKNFLGGILLLIGAVICASVFNLLSRRQSDTFTATERTYFMFLVAAAGFNIISLFRFGTGYVNIAFSALHNTDFLIGVLFLGVVSSCFSFWLYNYSTGQISVIRSAAFANISTVVSVLAGMIILKEPVSLLQLILCVPIIAGVFGVNYYAK